MMAGMNQQPPVAGVTPPSTGSCLPYTVNGQAAGPFDMATLAQMATTGQFAAASLVWKPGMASWSRADAIDELKALFNIATPTMPPIPQE